MVFVNRDNREKLEGKLRIDEYLMMPIDFNELFGRVRLQIRNFQYQEKLRTEYIKVYITDRLTGLYNKEYLESYFSYIIKGVESKKDSYILCMLDIDNFKKVNDKYGHARGDRVLKYVSKIILRNVRSGDFIGRFGGEEFDSVLRVKKKIIKK